MNFNIEGPFELERTGSGLVDSSAEAKREYWEWVEECCPGLPEACGCYVFTIKASRGSLPWYVGKAEKQSFRKECLTSHKLVHFNNVTVGRRGKPEIFFVPQVTGSGKYRKTTTSTRPAIAALESLLIGMALNRNQELANVVGTKWLNQLTVGGFLNSKKKKTGASKEFRNLFD